MDKIKNLEEYENNTDNSILSVYANVKKMNNFKSLIAENNEEIINEMGKYDKKIAIIEGKLDILQDSFEKKNEIKPIKYFQEFETKLNNEIIHIVDERKKETDKSVQELSKKIEEKINTQINNTLLDFNNKIENINKKNQELVDDITLTTENTNNTISTNIEAIRNEFIEAEKNYLNKLQDLEQALNKQLETEKKDYKKLLTKSIEALNIKEIQNSISNFETLNIEKIKVLEDNINQKINETKEINTQEAKKEISELETRFKNQLIESIQELNIEEIKNNIANIETSNNKKFEVLENNVTQKIEDINYSKAIIKLENATKNLKENLLNTEHFSNALSKKVEELEIVNQKKLDKLKIEQEKFVIKKISKLDSTEEINNLKINLREITRKIQSVESLINKIQEKSSIEMQNYVEKRISKMKFTATIQLIAKELNEIKKRISLLENTEEDTDLDGRIESIINQRLQKKEKEIMKNIDAVVEEKVQEALKEIARKQKIKKAQQSEIQKKQAQKNNILLAEKNRITNKKRASNVPSSLDDMVATLSNIPTSKSKKSISTIAKTTKKSQILNSNNY